MSRLKKVHADDVHFYDDSNNDAFIYVFDPSLYIFFKMQLRWQVFSYKFA